jgi:hypothetical protein
MHNLIINRVKYKIDNTPMMYLSKHDGLLFVKQSRSLKEKIIPASLLSYAAWCTDNNITDEDDVSYDFSSPEGMDNLLSLEASKYFYPKYIKSILIHFFKQRNFLVEASPRVYDLCVYEKIGVHNANWGKYRKYNLNIIPGEQEISFSIGSNKTLISNEPFSTQYTNIKGVSVDNGEVKGIEKFDGLPSRIIANKQLKKDLGISDPPTPVNYRDIYKLLSTFFDKNLKQVTDENLSIPSLGLLNVKDKDIFKVTTQDNRMLFGNSKRDINVVTGMRDSGAFKTPPKVIENKFIFIYENSDDANKLYQFLKNGLRHFTGLERYVGVPVTLDRDYSFKYTSIQTLQEEFDHFLQDRFSKDIYDSYFAIVIGPFNKEDSDEEESALYYHIKEKLLSKGISSQFVSYKNIRNDSTFHFFLPNIAIAINAKLGGIPWRLDNKSYQELIVGFNQIKLGNKSYIGSAVFFNNEGYLGSVNAFPKSETSKILIEHLRETIKKYIKENNSLPKRLVIHYYKPHSKDEKEKIEDLLSKELNIDIPFAVIEINDTKSHADICFDTEYDLGMPESGIYVKTAWNEYLLFNNSRYEKKPLRKITEELPIKVKIHFADSREFSNHELISQVYEFSRLYWKSLKQRSQPVTTIYSKLIAEFSAHFKGELPDQIAENSTPWFL